MMITFFIGFSLREQTCFFEEALSVHRIVTLQLDKYYTKLVFVAFIDLPG